MDSKKRIKAEMWDKSQYLFRRYYDRVTHSVFYFDGHLDLDALTTAFGYIMTNIPLMHSTFKRGLVSAHWEVNFTWSPKDAITVINTDNPDSELDKFVTGDVMWSDKYQIKIGVIRSEKKDILCYIVNHMLFDGGDLKNLYKLLFDCYNQAKRGETLNIPVKNGTRSAMQIYTGHSDEEAKAARGLYKNISNLDDERQLNFSGDQTDFRKRIIRKEVEAEVFPAVNAKAKAMGASFNDAITTAYMRAVYKLANVPHDESISVPSMVDLRRHIKGGDSFGFCNQVGMMTSHISHYDEDFSAMLSEVSRFNNELKKDPFLGMYGIPLLNLAYKRFPITVSEMLIYKYYKNPKTGISNIGLIDKRKLVLDGLTLENAWMTGAIKNMPYMQVALTTFDNRVTFTSGLKCGKKDAELIESLLDCIANDLRAFTKASVNAD